ncbi:MAG: glycosyl transferase [Paludibacter sp.]|nr:glycosyl transferase [Paludibacter sp.]
MKNLAPIILFVYNRPLHTEKTLNALKNNNLASESVLYIYCDGPKKEATAETVQLINEVRSVIKRDKWCKEVYVIERHENKGLANSVIMGVSEVIQKHEKVIVLEDDLITSPFFLNYMNESLDFYMNYNSVFSVSADRPPINKLQIPANYTYDVFASIRNYSYGWGTWINRWEKVDWEMKLLPALLENNAMKNAFNRGGDDLSVMLQMQQNKQIDSWSIRFTFAHFIQHSVSIMPCKSYVQNIGMDGSGMHCKATNIIPSNTNFEIPDSRSFKFLDCIYEDDRIINEFYSFYTTKKRPLWQKIINRISRMLGGKNVFVIKKKIYA